jgi:2-methylcitrate dehydratase PrpD
MTNRGADTEPMGPTLTEQLAVRLSAAVDADARARAMRHLVDWVGCVCGAHASALPRRLRELARAAPAGPCHAAGVGARGADAALLVNASVGNVLEMDDVHRVAILHPGPVVIPAALAVAERVDADGKALLDAIVRGYEAMIRIGASLGRGHYAYWHPTSTAGAFGAAAAAASLLGLDAARTADALGTAGSRTGGLWQMRHEAVPTKSLHNVEAAKSGVFAADLAAAGIRGPRAILEGPQGLYAATAPGADPSEVVADADAWRIAEVSLKPWAACRHAHPALDALRVALAQPFDSAQLALVEIATYAEAIRFCDRPEPETELEAKFSLQHVAAAVILRDAPGLADFAPATLADPAFAALRARVVVVEDPAMTRAFPAHYAARARVLFDDGSERTAAVRDAWGDPAWPLGDDDLGAKFDGLVAWGGVDPALAQAAVARAWALGDGGSARAFGAALGALA